MLRIMIGECLGAKNHGLAFLLCILARSKKIFPALALKEIEI